MASEAKADGDESYDYYIQQIYKVITGWFESNVTTRVAIVMRGPPGVGKTTFAKAFRDNYQAYIETTSDVETGVPSTLPPLSTSKWRGNQGVAIEAADDGFDRKHAIVDKVLEEVRRLALLENGSAAHTAAIDRMLGDAKAIYDVAVPFNKHIGENHLDARGRLLAKLLSGSHVIGILHNTNLTDKKDKVEEFVAMCRRSNIKTILVDFDVYPEDISFLYPKDAAPLNVHGVPKEVVTRMLNTAARNKLTTEFDEEFLLPPFWLLSAIKPVLDLDTTIVSFQTLFPSEVERDTSAAALEYMERCAQHWKTLVESMVGHKKTIKGFSEFYKEHHLLSEKTKMLDQHFSVIKIIRAAIEERIATLKEATSDGAKTRTMTGDADETAAKEHDSIV